MAMMGAHSRNLGGARRISSATTTSVTAAVARAPVIDPPSGMSVNDSKAMGITVAAMSMMTVPDTTGVKMRRSHESLEARAN